MVKWGGSEVLGKGLEVKEGASLSPREPARLCLFRSRQEMLAPHGML